MLDIYIIKYRILPKPLCQNYLFVNQRGENFTRHGINRMCKKYLTIALQEERAKMLNPVSSFRHSCAVDMLCSGKSPDEIKYHLGHQSINSTMVYLHLDINRPREIQEKMTAYCQSILPQDPKLEDLIDWRNKKKILNWLDSL
jgi:site-specific recombinase XerD